MPGARQVSFTSPYGAEEAEILRQQRMAEMLRAQASQPMGGTEMAGPIAIRRSPFEGLAQLAKGASAGAYERKAKEMAEQLRTRQQGDRSADMTAIAGMLRGAPATSETIVDEQANGGMGAPATINAPARPGGVDPAMLAQLRSPEMQQMGMQMWADQMKPKAPLKGGPGDQFLDPTTYKPIATIPHKPEKPAAVPSAIQEYEYAQKQGFKGSFHEFQISQRKAGASNVQVRTDVKTGESLAGQVGPMMKDSTAIAEGAVKQVDAARRIVTAVDAGKIITGPTADARLLLKQVGQVLGVGGKDDAEQIANTRTALRGLAELTLQGRQQMKGQGAITESEGKLAEKAMSAEISLTAPEIRQLAQASERAARFNYAEHQRKLKVMQENKDLKHVAPFYQGPAMPAEAGGAAAPVQISPKTLEFLRSQGIDM